MKTIRSVMTSDLEHCFICAGKANQLHHVFGGCRRKISDQDGFVVPLCMECHTGPNGVHHNRSAQLGLMMLAQTMYEQTHTREEFLKRYGKSWL